MELLDVLIGNENSLKSCIPRHLHHLDAHGLFKLGLHRSTQAVTSSTHPSLCWSTTGILWTVTFLDHTGPLLRHYDFTCIPSFLLLAVSTVFYGISSFAHVARLDSTRCDAETFSKWTAGLTARER